ncbi:MAG: hypothetical protein WBS54_04745 [Acidobacteriota bacterium]
MMVGTLLSLVVAVAAFGWVLAPLFGEPKEISQARSTDQIQDAVDRSVRELTTDLELQKIQASDLKDIQNFLETESKR